MYVYACVRITCHGAILTSRVEVYLSLSNKLSTRAIACKMKVTTSFNPDVVEQKSFSFFSEAQVFQLVLDRSIVCGSTMVKL
jgi:hypothetical protein